MVKDRNGCQDRETRFLQMFRMARSVKKGETVLYSRNRNGKKAVLAQIQEEIRNEEKAGRF